MNSAKSCLSGIRIPSSSRNGVLLLCAFCALFAWAQAALAYSVLVVGENAQPGARIYTQTGASATELFAARELADYLQQITGAPFDIREAGTDIPDKAIVIGPGPAAERFFPGIAWNRLGEEEIVIRTSGHRLLLAGGQPRGTLYAVYRFLYEECNVRWWAPWAVQVPKKTRLAISTMDRQAAPAFEYREAFWFHAFDGLWAARNQCNGNSERLTDELGGHITYNGFVHTLYPLVPPDKHFAAHPEWYALIDGHRNINDSQFCLTNPQLLEEVCKRVLESMSDAPAARILSVSQNDNVRSCQCTNCQAMDAATGGPAGTMLNFVNAVARRVAPVNPKIAIDTLAYQYTRHAPKNVRPDTNVIVRLCSIECNFALPLSHPSNTTFATDLNDWSRISDRLYIWNYDTDFGHYLQPHPNYFVLGPNLRFYQANHVKGFFGQGAYQSNGGEMAELKAWVTAQLMWNPKLNDRALIREFLRGYYGEAAALPIERYLKLMSEAAGEWNLTCFSPVTTQFLNFEVLSQGEVLWRQAETAAAADPDLLWRVKASHLSLQYVWLKQWNELRQQCGQKSGQWPFVQTREALAAEWLAQATGQGPKGWSPVTHLNEGGITPEKFVKDILNKPAKP
jgi:hypothetical protein